jgi:hypothetical protein
VSILVPVASSHFIHLQVSDTFLLPVSLHPSQFSLSFAKYLTGIQSIQKLNKNSQSAVQSTEQPDNFKMFQELVLDVPGSEDFAHLFYNTTILSLFSQKDKPVKRNVKTTAT